MSLETNSAEGFKPVEIEEVDARLAEVAARKSIPSMVATSSAKEPVVSTPLRAPSKPLTLDVPDYLRVALKIDAARKGVSVRYLVLTALVEQGFDVEPADLIEDGRRLR
jgi:hypothetical protein